MPTDRRSKHAFLLLATLTAVFFGLTPHAAAATPRAGIARAQALAAAAPASPQSVEATAAFGTPFKLYPDLAGYYGWGFSVSAAGDVNGDGYADFLASNATVSPWGTWAVALYYGSANGPVMPPGWVRTTYTRPAHVSAAGDVNNDGYDDVIIGSGSMEGTGTGGGVVEVFLGTAGGLASIPAFAHTGDNAYGASVCTAGDVNADGYDDVIVGDPLTGTVGAATIYYGSASGTTTVGSWTMTGTVAGERAGSTVAGLGDVNGDGFDDVGIGSDRDGDSPTDARVYLGSSITPTYASVFSDQYMFSSRVTPAGDVNADGYADFWIMDTRYDNYPAPWGFGLGILALGGPSGITGTAWAGGTTNAQLSALAFTAGDFNGDGVGDACYGDQNDLYLNFHVIRGRRGGSSSAQSVVTLALESDLRPSASAAGDVNGDGFGDVLVGLPGRSDFVSGGGVLLLYYGHADLPTSATERFGAEDQALAGWSIATGDVNGDGFDDVAIGSPLADGLGYVDCGRVQLYLGSADGISATPALQCFGVQDNDQFGISLSMGQDVNGDGYGDIVAGAHAGEHVHVWLGSADWSLANDQPDWTLTGPQPGSYFGSSVALAGDVNGDGFADVIVGAPLSETITGGGSALFHHPQAGKVYLFAGSHDGLVGPVWTFSNNQDYGQVGTSVAAAGDVNADGYSDLVFGSGLLDAPGAEQGVAYCALGASTWPAALPGFFWAGAAAGDYFGQAVTGMGDIDADGYADLAIGAFGAGGTGKVYVVRGGASGPEAAPWITYEGGTPGAAFGSSVAPAGDVDGDGYSDLIVGEVFGNGPSLTGCGAAYVFHGGSSFLLAPIASFTGVANGDNLGHSVAGGGDFDGDGFGDLLMGMPRRTNTQFWEGSVRAVYGNTANNIVPGLSQGHARPTFATRAGPGASPLAIYGRSRNPNAFGLASRASSAGGRDAVALEWRVVPRVGAGAGVQGRTAWANMNAPTAPLAGAKSITPQVSGLGADGVYGWRTRVLSRSPWFRYGSWFTPQPNGRGNWDVRTILGPDDVPLASTGGALELSTPWPNPTAGRVRLDFALPAETRVRAVVRDLQGREVRMLADGPYAAGSHPLQWDGTEASGRVCAPGIYFVDLVAGTEHRTARIVRLQ